MKKLLKFLKFSVRYVGLRNNEPFNVVVNFTASEKNVYLSEASNNPNKNLDIVLSDKKLINAINNYIGGDIQYVESDEVVLTNRFVDQVIFQLDYDKEIVIREYPNSSYIQSVSTKRAEVIYWNVAKIYDTTFCDKLVKANDDLLSDVVTFFNNDSDVQTLISSI